MLMVFDLWSCRSIKHRFALLKLVADKHLWARCKHNGLKNIHLFSWPEHCKNYLARITCCRPRHPQWESCTVGYEYSESQSPEDSLRDLNDLKISLDGVINDQGIIDIYQKADMNSPTFKRKLSIGKKLESLTKLSAKLEKSTAHKAETLAKIGSQDKLEFPGLRRKKSFIVVAVDSGMTKELLEIMKMVIEIARVEKGEFVGLILSTVALISEIHSFLQSGKIDPLEAHYKGAYSITCVDARVKKESESIFNVCVYNTTSPINA